MSQNVRDQVVTNSMECSVILKFVKYKNYIHLPFPFGGCSHAEVLQRFTHENFKCNSIVDEWLAQKYIWHICMLVIVKFDDRVEI